MTINTLNRYDRQVQLIQCVQDTRERSLVNKTAYKNGLLLPVGPVRCGDL